MTPLRLLQVEDREDDAVLVTRELSRAGYDVFAVRVDTAEALSRELSHAQWDVVIADYTMPGFSGSKALNMVRERDLDVPFIFVSGTIGEDTAVAAMRTGAQDYIIKGNLTRLAPAVERELRDAAVRHERNVANRRVAYLAYHDPLTDLPNRALLHERLEQAILRSFRDEKGLALLIVDLDGFKEINDAYGHHAGDQVLQEVASRLKGTLRSSDTVARMGGDEFAVLLPATDVNRAELAARKVLHDLEHPFTADGRAVMASASIGIAGFPIHAATAQELLQRADAAMYSRENRKGRLLGVRAGTRSPRLRKRRARHRAAAGDRRAAVRARLPADRAPAGRHHRRDRSAGAVGASRTGPPAAVELHPPGRAHRPGQPVDVVRARAGAGRLAGRRRCRCHARWRSMSRPAACITRRLPARSATC